ncbi:Peptidase_M13 domain-containing protein [Caenorhabditis elegans]|uniref:Peptidase_M13 domain-containing protein n=1 Tax=Caenorhabditis elegans TaxID=6239 RepID=O76562_CAEEL|nr:Peptidase_M13 domain-containing protein [Caenorhabditis elegans]CCD69436.1 Peptidase_M13 domain-containing protein [Caenorhabditis elegans]|eukprot:NP_001123129.1 Uncharacterized protein CELE_F13C5.3 [Caenorhabditis elegans]
MIFCRLILVFLFQISCSKKINFDKVYKDAMYASFLKSEFNYTSFLRRADHSAERYVPFQDTSNDTFFKVGILHKSQLENYTKIRMEDQLGTLKNKPWMPINEIREEFANCALLKFGSFSEHDFKYDKGMYGWMNIMKFSCARVLDQYLVFGMAFTRTRFRLKQVILKRQNTHWATSGRSLITRDVQKITEIFTIRFGQFVNEKLEDELRKHAISTKNIAGNPLNLKNDTFEELAVAYGRLRKHIKLSDSRGHTFSTLAFGIKSRILVTSPSHAPQAVEAISDELSDAPLKVLDTCHKDICTYDYMKNATFNPKTETYSYVKENALINTVHPRYSLIAFQKSKPYFTFEKMKRKTATKIIDVKQNLDTKAKNLWSSLLDQQFTLAIHVHNQELFPFDQFFMTLKPPID